ncbi:aminotransferase class IV [Hyphococcus luteus]|uniref:Probable branched-chain-amino-acid aminotransferase n=1 Tax=Hyphococcus luteus TaxID=2058213 RepID=A0A2S7K5Q4_9PROT|nr:aminotransferase class IV [Marinicaulis flavus]PQA87837.1 2-keto-4-methylthiobutyrate aminotransferase [Marinicaulis flavus]
MAFWLNGAYREDSTAIDIADRGFLLGDGVFETILLSGGLPAFLSAHLARMRAGAEALGIEAKIDEAAIAGALAELARRNEAQEGFASARLTLTRGVGPRGLVVAKGVAKPTLLATADAYAPPDGAEALRFIVSRQRRNELSAASRWKTLNYLDNILARAQATEAGADDALMLNSAGRIACASAANIFLIRGESVTTPPVSEGALPGIVRAVLLENAGAAGVEMREAPVEAKDLDGAALFVTNSLVGLRPAALRGGAPDGEAQVLKRLQSCYGEAMKRDLEGRAGQ